MTQNTQDRGHPFLAAELYYLRHHRRKDGHLGLSSTKRKDCFRAFLRHCYTSFLRAVDADLAAEMLIRLGELSFDRQALEGASLVFRTEETWWLLTKRPPELLTASL